MRVLKKKTINRLIQEHAEASADLKVWYAVMKAADYSKGQDVLTAFPKAKTLGGGERVRFEIHGGNYRLIAAIRYQEPKICWIKFFGTHAEYDRIDALTIDQFRGE